MSTTTEHPLCVSPTVIRKSRETGEWEATCACGAFVGSSPSWQWTMAIAANYRRMVAQHVDA